MSTHIVDIHHLHLQHFKNPGVLLVSNLSGRKF